MLQTGATDLGIELDRERRARLEQLLYLLLDWNQRMNLTAVTDPSDVAVKHMLDSMTCVLAAPFPQRAAVLDVGTGAGFPGLVLKIMRPDLTLALLDSTRKKLSFVEHAIEQLQLSSARAVFGRAEELGKAGPLRESFDVVVARAVAPLRILAELCIPFVRVGGVFLAMKGPGVAEEAPGAQATVERLGGAYQPLRSFSLPFDGGQRAILPITKANKTPADLPRLYRDIRRQPLQRG